MKKLAIVITHPIQYYAPVFKLLTERNIIEIKVYYTWGEEVLVDKYDPSFGKVINWDIPLLEGYNFHFTKNIAKKKGSSHFKGIINPQLVKEINNWNPCAILVYGWSYKSHLKIIRHFKGKIPVWFRGDSNLLDNEFWIKKILKYFYLKYFVFRFIDKAFYVGNNNKKYFELYGLKDKQLVFSPHAIDNMRFSEERKEEALLLRNKFGISISDNLILFAGKFEPKKNPEILLDAFDKIILPNVHLLFVGNGELEKKLKDKTKTMNMKNNIHFMDFQNQSYMPVIYQASNIFCLPSKGPGETWGLAINEAMAAGNTIIASDKVGCASDLVSDGINGYVFNFNNSNQLKILLLKILNNKELILAYGKASKKMIQKWTFENQINAIEYETSKLPC